LRASFADLYFVLMKMRKALPDQPFTVVVAYEEYDSGLRALELYHRILAHWAEAVDFRLIIWKFEPLGIPTLLAKATDDAIHADLILVSLSQLDRRIDLAARGLGASVWERATRIIMPNIKFGIVTAALLSFVLSWEEIGVTLFITSVNAITLPRLMWMGLRDNIDPAIAALSVILIIITVLTVEETFHNFDLMYTLTGGGPYFHTEIIEIYIYRWAFGASIPQLGQASAAAVFFGLLVAVVGALQLWGVYAGRRLRGEQR